MLSLFSVHRPVAHRDSSKVFAEQQSVVLRLQSTDGTLGWGEAAPLVGRSVESYDDVVAALKACDVKGWVRDSATITERLAAVRQMTLPASAEFAMLSAVLELDARRAGQSMQDHLYREASQDPTTATPRDGGVTKLAALVSDTRLSDASYPMQLRELGFEHVKLKVGVDLPAELRAAEQYCAAGFSVRADANGSLSSADDVSALLDAGVDVIEEPGVSLSESSDTRLQQPSRWLALDESLLVAQPTDLLAKDFHTLVLKPTVLGLSRTLEFIGVTKELSREVYISHSLEGPIAHAMLCELSLSCSRLAGVTALADAHVLFSGYRGSYLESHGGLGLNLNGVEAWLSKMGAKKIL